MYNKMNIFGKLGIEGPIKKMCCPGRCCHTSFDNIKLDFL